MNIPVVTISNFGYLPYVENLRESIRRAGIEWKLIVLCMDTNPAEYCKDRNIPYFPCKTEAGEEALNFTEHHQDAVNWILFQKLDCLRQFMITYPQIQEYIYMDGDIVVFKNFVPYIEQFARSYDMVFQCDESITTPTCHSYLPGTVCVNVCTGFIYMKNTPLIRDILDFRKHIQSIKTFETDQDYINRMIKGFIKKQQQPPFSVLRKRVKWTTFPREIITNGSYLGNLPLGSYILHYNFLVGTNKKKRMQENGHWFITD